MPVPPSRRRQRRWIAFFLLLAALSTFAMVVPLIYNLSIQLRPEQLADARRRWQEKGTNNYDLQYLVERRRLSEIEPDKSEYLVQVREGRVVLVVDSGEIVYLDSALTAAMGSGILALSSETASHYGVPALFEEIEEALHRDETAGRKNYTRAQFDPKDGHPLHYVQSVRSTKERVEWHVKFQRVEARPQGR